MEDLNKLTGKIIGCAIEVHKNLGPGLLESIYEKALCVEFDLNDIRYKNQVLTPVNYKGHSLGEFRLDLLVEDLIILEIKAVEKIIPLYEAQLLSYLKLFEKKLGLLMNFNSPVLKNGIKRLIL